MIQALKDDWDSRKNQFDKPGEAFWEARIDGQLVGVCGLNRDPYESDDSIGRIRRMYVSVEFRRIGAGRALVETALQHATNHFQTVQVRSQSDADQFYVAVGFQSVTDNPVVSHRIRFA